MTAAQRRSCALRPVSFRRAGIHPSVSHNQVQKELDQLRSHGVRASLTPEPESGRGAVTNQTIQSKLPFVERLGMHPQLALGYLGLLLFMIGDGVEAGFLSPLLMDLHFSPGAGRPGLHGLRSHRGVASWLSGALSDIFGPKKVMWAGLLIWIGFEMPFLSLGIAHANYSIILLSYGLRGFGYPLFAYGFLVWVAAVTPERYLGTAIGWFWSARHRWAATLAHCSPAFRCLFLGT